MKIAIALLFTLVLSLKVNAATIRVPQDQSRIQAAVDAASNGDTVLVSPGVYSGNGNIDISFRGKSIILVSSAGYSATILDGLNSGFRAISLSSGEDSNSVISGFTFTRFHGGAIRCYGASPRVENNKFTFNSAGDGAAIYVTGGAMKIRSNQFYGNFAGRGGALFAAGIDNGTLEVVGNRVDSCSSGSEGGGVFVQLVTSDAIITRNVFSRVISPFGGAIRLATANNVNVINNTFDQNWAAEGAGIDVANSFGAIIKNNIFLNTSDGYALYLRNTAEEDHNCFFSNLPSHVFGAALDPTDILTDPQFSSSDSSDYDLEYFSPCVDAGDPNPIYNDPDGSRSDIGAFPLRAQANVIHVPQDFPTIQAAINALYFADTILVSPGVYVENLDAKSKEFHLIGTNGADSTIIVSASDSVPIFHFDFDDFPQKEIEGDEVNISGLTFRGAVGTNAIDVTPVHSFKFRGCLFDSNAVGEGRFVLSIDTAPEFTLIDCKFNMNMGGLVEAEGSEVLLDSNVVLKNSGPILFSLISSDNTEVNHNLFYDNEGIILQLSGQNNVFVRRNRFSHNTGSAVYTGNTDGLFREFRSNMLDSNAVDNLVSLYLEVHGEWVDIDSNLILHNNVTHSMEIYPAEGLRFRANTVHGNFFGDTLGILGSFPDCISYVVTDNIITSNDNTFGLRLYDGENQACSFQVVNNDCWQNQAGNFGGDVDSILNISVDPLFCDAPDGDFTLAGQSPAIGMGFLGVGCSAVLDVELVTLENQSTIHVTNPQPRVLWHLSDPPGQFPQSSFEIAVSTDNDWQFAEMWNPAPFASADTFVVYSGAPLLDGHSYWLRLRVSNSLGWSNWSELMFRMNSVPTAPQLRLPANNSIVASQFPNLTIRNPFDAESDSMFLTIEISADSFATSFFPFQSVPSIDSLTTVAVPVMLNENARFWWRVKASDYYEESTYSPIWSFWVNSSNTAPSAFSLLSPPNTQSPTLADNTPEFTWQPSFDCDPGDSVKFTLQLSIDASFSFASQIPGLTNPQYVPTKPLEWGRRYWWRVKAEDKSTGVTWSNEVFSFTTMRLGDPDGNGIVTISDAVFLINYIFSGGPEPNPLSSGDADCNGIVTISDAVYLINYIFAGGPPPCES